MVNKCVQIKRIMILLSIVGSVPLCAMDNKKPPRRSPRLALLYPQNLQVSPVQKGIRKPRVQKAQQYNLDDIMLRPIMVEGFRKVIEEQRRY